MIDEGNSGGAGEATTIGAYTQAIATALEHRGVDSARLFREAGLEVAYGNDPLSRVAVSKLTRLFKLCVEVTDDPYFGLTVARIAHLSTLHALGYSLMASHNLVDFGRRLERYFRLLSEVATMRLNVQAGSVALVSTDVVESCAETQDAWLAYMVRFIRLLSQTEIDPIRVEFMHAMPAEGAAPYEEYFRCPVQFGCRENILTFDRAAFERPLPGSCPELAQFNDNIAADYIARLDHDDVIARVRGKIVRRLDSDSCDRDAIASDLGMAPSTLARKLSKRGSSFNEILNDTRRELALTYLQQAHLPVTEIAFRLGFTDLSNFTHAFKRWTGQSPSNWRSTPLAS